MPGKLWYIMLFAKAGSIVCLGLLNICNIYRLEYLLKNNGLNCLNERQVNSIQFNGK